MFAVALALLGAAPAWSQTGDQASKAPAAKVDHSGDDQAIAKTREDIQAAVNNHDAKALAAFFATDGDVRAIDGELIRGRAAIEKYYAALFNSRLKDAKITGTATVDTRYLGANVAITNGTAEITGAKGLDGKDIPPYTLLVTGVLVKRNGTWQTLSQRTWPANAIPGPTAAKRKTS
jgi:uncharacterized protein (TIGR02246 family)